MTALTPEAINDLLAESRDRGGAERYLRKFATSGELNDVVQDNPQFAAKKEASLYNSLNQNITKIRDKSPEFPNLKVIRNKDHGLVLVNMDVRDAMIAEMNGNGSEPTEASETEDDS